MYNSDHCRLRKIGIKNGVHPEAEYGGAISASGNEYCLFEDIFICGMMRYGINVGGGSSNCDNILRRVVARWEYCTTAQPRAAITVYGGSQGTPPCENILLQNCIVIDGNSASGSTFTGGFSVPHETSNVHRYGCISLNNGGYGFHSSEDELSHDNTNTHCVVWDSGNGMWWRHLASGTSGAYNCTFEDTGPAGSSDAGRGSIYECEAKDNVFINCNAANMTASGNVTSNRGDFTYIIRSPIAGKGATIEKKMGVTGTLYGENGYNLLQDGTNEQADENLWPWPYEDKIKELFTEVNAPPSGYGLSPLDNDTTRGFCAGGDFFEYSDGVPVRNTLTRYIWEYYSGNPMPVLYDAPTGLGAVAAETEISLSWTEIYKMESGFRIERKTDIGGTYEQIADVGADVISYNDTGLAMETTYYYRIKAYNSMFESDYSNETHAKTGYILNPPTSFRLSDDSSMLCWYYNPSDVPGYDAAGFKIERVEGSILSPEITEIKLADPAKLYYEDTGCVSGINYYYRIRAYNDKADSIFSDWVGPVTILSIGDAEEPAPDSPAPPVSSPAASSSNSGGGGGGGCFIATAAYGTPMAEQVKIFKKIRDEYLLNSKSGRAFIGLYYGCSVPIADYISKRNWLRKIVCILLEPIIFTAGQID
ncbi:MAG: fibronectin type III domain-containing protein [Candidatus Omnitrophica bacterium]|nr:fibronectin type III domain-containing protein [Candidatus Omnitrophota bacterium]